MLVKVTFPFDALRSTVNEVWLSRKIILCRESVAKTFFDLEEREENSKTY